MSALKLLCVNHKTVQAAKTHISLPSRTTFLFLVHILGYSTLCAVYLKMLPRIGQEVVDLVTKMLELKFINWLFQDKNERVKHQNPRYLKDASYEIRSDKQVVLETVMVNGYELAYASKALRADKEVVLAAVGQNIITNNNRHYERKEFHRFQGHQTKDEIVLVPVDTKNRWILHNVSDELRANRDVIHAAVNNCGASLQFASKELQGDKGIVLQAVQSDGLALLYASEELRGDKEVVLMAVTNVSMAIAYASEELRDDKEIALATMKQDFKYACTCMNLSRHAYYYLSTRLQQDPHIHFYRDFVSKGIADMILDYNIPQSLWANILAKKSNLPFYIFYYLTNKPDLVKDVMPCKDESINDMSA